MLAAFKNLVPLLLYGIGIIIFVVALSGRPRIGLFFFLPLIPLQNVISKLYIYPFGNNFNDVLFLGILIGWMISKMVHREPFFERSSLNWLLILYFVFTFCSLWQGSSYLGDPAPFFGLDERVRNWKNYMLLPLIFFLTLNNFKDVKDLKKIFVLMCGTMLLMNYYTLQQISEMTSWVSRDKLCGTFEYLGANPVAAFYATYTFVLIGIFFLTKKIWHKLMLMGLVILNFCCVLFIYSRGAYIAVLVGFAFLALVRKRLLIIPIVLILFSWQSLLPQRVVERIMYTDQGGQLDESAQARLVLWQQSLDYFKGNPLIGIGFNVFFRLGKLMDTHNVYLRTMAEQGLVGLWFLLMIMGQAVLKSWRLYRTTSEPFLKWLGLGFCACSLAVMVGNIFGDRWTYLQLGAFYWVFLGMVERGNLITAQEAVASKSAPQKSKPSAKLRRRG